MYYILNAGEPINDFAVKPQMHRPKNKDTSRDGGKNPEKKEVGGWISQRFPDFFNF